MSNHLASEIAKYPWFHSIDLGAGIITPGAKTPYIHRQELHRFLIASRFRPKRFGYRSMGTGFTALKPSVAGLDEFSQQIHFAGLMSTSGVARHLNWHAGRSVWKSKP